MITDHPRYAQIMTYVNSFITNVSTQQADYFITNGRYFQGIKLLGEVQPDGNTDINMDATSKPSDQLSSWNDFLPSVFKNNIKIPVQVTVSPYERNHEPKGFGWILRIELWHTGLGEDYRGRTGNHWIYNYHEGPVAPEYPIEQWYVVDDTIVV